MNACVLGQHSCTAETCDDWSEAWHLGVYPAQTTPKDMVSSQMLQPCKLTRQIDAALSKFSHVASSQVCQISV